MNAMSGRPFTSNFPIACSLPVYIFDGNKVKPKYCLSSFSLASTINILQVSMGEDGTVAIRSKSPESGKGLGRLDEMLSCSEISKECFVGTEAPFL